MRVQRGNAVGDRDMELVEVHFVALPRQRFSISGEHNSGDLADWPRRPMIPGDPLWRGERKGPGLYGQIDLGMIKLARRIGKVGGDANRLSLRMNGQNQRRHKKKEQHRRGSATD